jgi:NAD-dependent dihydropyrimidine dehydrogenase PreA subunit
MTTRMREVVRIDEDKCDGCGLCVPSCAEGAIRVIDGKARLVADNLCDGLGNCLGACPKDAITIERRPAADFDEEAVEAHLAGDEAPAEEPAEEAGGPSRLGQWPVQLALLPPGGEIWDGADVLLAADCAAYAVGDFHDRFLAGRTVAVACPKLDETDGYDSKLRRILAGNDIRSVTVVRMEVPCCGGLETLARNAVEASGLDMPLNVVTVTVDGRVQEVNGLKVA